MKVISQNVTYPRQIHDQLDCAHHFEVVVAVAAAGNVHHCHSNVDWYHRCLLPVQCWYCSVRYLLHYHLQRDDCCQYCYDGAADLDGLTHCHTAHTMTRSVIKPIIHTSIPAIAVVVVMMMHVVVVIHVVVVMMIDCTGWNVVLLLALFNCIHIIEIFRFERSKGRDKQ